MDESLIEKQNGNFANTVLGAVPSVVYNEDCVEGLKRFSDNYFDLAIVDRLNEEKALWDLSGAPELLECHTVKS